jgi:hypothetical protein
MADLEFFFDPVCPWAWITSRWVVNVQEQQNYQVNWRFISLYFLNDNNVADWYDANYRAGHRAGLRALRVADAVRVSHDNDAVGRFYTALGQVIHVGQFDRAALRTKTGDVIAAALVASGLPEELTAEADHEGHDAYLRAETELALSRTGKDVGTPILTFKPGQQNEGSFFGPVLSRAPRGQDAVDLWNAIELIATTSGMAELKRSNRARPQFD